MAPYQEPQRKRPFIVIPNDPSRYEGFPVREEFESTKLFEKAVLQFWRRRKVQQKRAKMSGNINELGSTRLMGTS